MKRILKASIPAVPRWASLFVVLTILLIPAASLQAKQPPNKAYGQVVAIHLKHHSGTMSGFDLSHNSQTLMFKVNSSTKFHPRSSAADVQGFVQGDYAYVHAKGDTAHDIEYDASPFHPRKTEYFSGVVVKTGHHKLIVIRKDSGSKIKKVHWNGKTSFSVNGQYQDQPVPIHAGDDLTVYAEKHPHKWIALLIDEHVSS